MVFSTMEENYLEIILDEAKKYGFYGIIYKNKKDLMRCQVFLRGGN